MKIIKLSLIAVAVISMTACKKEDVQQPPQMPKAVSYISIKEEPVKIQSELKGRLSAIEEAEVRPQVTGIIEAIKVKDGQEVKRGDVLYKIDSAKYQAEYNQALASFKSVKADIETAKLKAQRYEELAKTKAVPMQDADDAKSAYNKLLASLEEKKAAVDMAKIQLEYTDIKAPIDGKIGISSVTKGALVTANQTNSINTITKLNPIYLDITQQSKDFLDMTKLSQEFESKNIPVEIRMNLGDEPILGYVSSNELKVDPQTDSIKVRAKFDNVDKTLLPGMYAYATITYAIKNNGVKVPMQTVMKKADGSTSVYVIENDNKIKEVKVNILQNSGNQMIVSEGLKSGDKVVIEGIEKVKTGDVVTPMEKK